MIILALDATAIASSVALLRDGVCLCKAQNLDAGTHSCTLLPTVERLLNQTGLAVEDIDLFAASAGPGSFTGVRIGAATLKGLAFGQNKPCVPVSALCALAYNLRDFDGVVCALMDARRGQFYTATFKIENGKVTRLSPDAAESGEEIAARLAGCPSVTLVGDGAEAALRYFGENAHLCAPVYRLCDGESVARLAAEAFERGEFVSDTEFAPTYLRLPQAERERLEKLKNGEKK
ncbi:MAG: tRNA (adenosine(37)-N6)-threonylcarbamoyltransferase complex dimerization subunit type 1 TsaB [Clostridia bacterium]|nr:tRNA (adenosine(37)-N6)-threonylcarbamoyltransferase complex dimerization subunit type 1 TsaB [Clostridia bacterium]